MKPSVKTLRLHAQTNFPHRHRRCPYKSANDTTGQPSLSLIAHYCFCFFPVFKVSTGVFRMLPAGYMVGQVPLPYICKSLPVPLEDPSVASPSAALVFAINLTAPLPLPFLIFPVRVSAASRARTHAHPASALLLSCRDRCTRPTVV